MVELSGKATLSAVTAAVENAQTPHRTRTAPAVDAVVPGKVKPGATPEAITAALKKAEQIRSRSGGRADGAAVANAKGPATATAFAIAQSLSSIEVDPHLVALTEPLRGRLPAEAQAEPVDSAITDDTITH